MKNRSTIRSLAPFLCTEVLLYSTFLCCDLEQLNIPSTVLKYTALLLCLLFSLRSFGTEDGRLVSLCLLLTALADWFLLVIDRYYIVGLLLFCLVQFLYALRICRLHPDSEPLFIVPRLLLSGAALLVLFFSDLLTPLTALVSLYFPQLICNAAESRFLPHSMRTTLFSAGLFFFLGCDICVGIYNSPAYLPWFSADAVHLAQFAMWGFYLPSQVFIVLSAYRGISS